MKKVIITGATGQDGSYMVEYLLKNTDNTIIAAIRRTSQAILSNLKNALDNPRVSLVTLDLADGEAIRKLIKQERPDYFINLGAQTFVADSWNHPISHMQTNALSLIYILEAVKEYNKNCVVYSAGSSEQFGDIKFSPQNEAHPMSPRSMYGVSKCAAAHICKVYRESYSMNIVHGILFNHESPRRQDYFVSRKISKGVARVYSDFITGREITPICLGNLDAKRDWSHAMDFVDGIWKMMNQPDGKAKEYVLSSGETHTVREFVESAFAALDPEGKRIWVGQGLDEYYFSLDWQKILVKVDSKFYRPAEVSLLHGDSALARKELNWHPKINFHQLVKEMVTTDYENMSISDKT